MATFERRVQVTKTEAYAGEVEDWLSTEDITTLTVTNPDGRVTVGATQVDGYYLKVLVTGVTTGNATLHFNYTTATRTRCTIATVKVIDNC